MNNQDSHCRCGTEGEQVTVHPGEVSPDFSQGVGASGL